ncbi:MAG: hypothetical protein D6820_14060, partial [Lentisphaerae bacterium]
MVKARKHRETGIMETNVKTSSFRNAEAFGFSPEADPVGNQRALQKAVDRGGTIVVERPGIYRIGGTVYLPSYTTLQFANGVILQKEAAPKPFSHVFLNRGALSRTFDEKIRLEGLHLRVNGVDELDWQVYGLRGQ